MNAATRQARSPAARVPATRSTGSRLFPVESASTSNGRYTTGGLPFGHVPCRCCSRSLDSTRGARRDNSTRGGSCADHEVLDRTTRRAARQSWSRLRRRPRRASTSRLTERRDDLRGRHRCVDRGADSGRSSGRPHRADGDRDRPQPPRQMRKAAIRCRGSPTAGTTFKSSRQRRRTTSTGCAPSSQGCSTRCIQVSAALGTGATKRCSKERRSRLARARPRRESTSGSARAGPYPDESPPHRRASPCATPSCPSTRPPESSPIRPRQTSRASTRLRPCRLVPTT